jgi:uncharacterized repeat protein (TIGR01451 family)
LAAKSAQTVSFAALDVTKTASTSGTVGVGSVISYTITVQNVGNVTVSNVALTDTLKDLNNNALTITAPSFSSASTGSSVASLLPNGTLTYTVSYTLTQSNVDAGGVKNTVTATGTAPSGASVTDKSDNGNNTDGNTDDDDTVTSVTAAPALKVVKTASTSGTVGVGSVISYTITVQNVGNVTVSNVALTDTLTDANGGSHSRVVRRSAVVRIARRQRACRRSRR